MYHLVDNFTNTKGDALVGYYVKLKVPGGAYASLFADVSSTPIVSVSGIADTAITDVNGQFDLYVADGDYDIEFFDAADVTQRIRTISSVPMYGDTLSGVAVIAAQVAAETARTGAELAETGAETAQTAAELAETNAESAQSAAELAETGAETAQTAAELAETNAEAITASVSAALAAGTVSDLVGTRIYTTRALLEADLVPADGLYALVMGDATAANNDLYKKSGATTAGSWSGPLGFFASASAVALAAQESAAQAIDALSSATSLALTEIFGAASLALANTGPYFRVHPGYCFAERTAGASTPVAVGGVVGCIKSADGQFVALAGQDDRRPTLEIDATGKYYLDAAASNMLIHTAAGAAWDPTSTWTHIGGWQVDEAVPTVYDGTAFSWGFGNNQTRSIELRAQDNAGNVTRSHTALNIRSPLFSTTDDLITTPFVLRINKSLADIAAYYNLDPIRKAPAFVPWDDSAITRRICLFGSRPDLTSTTNMIGKFYGGLWVPTVGLTAREIQMATAEIMGHTIPTETVSPKSGYASTLDFEKSDFRWGNATRALTDLVDNGGGSYDLNDVRAWGVERTIIADIDTDQDEATPSGVMLEFLSDNGINERVMVPTYGSQKNIVNDYRGFNGGTGIAAAALVTALLPDAGNVRARIAWVIKPGEPVQIFTQHSSTTSDHYAGPLLPPNALRVNTTVTGRVLHRVAIYDDALTGQALYDAMIADRVSIHFLGDSFVVQGSDKALYDQFAAEGVPEVLISGDGAGGYAFFEAFGAGHTQRHAATPQHYGKITVIDDGGFEINRDATQYITGLMSIIQRLHPVTVDGTTNVRRFVFMEPNPLNLVADSRFTDWWAAVAKIKTMMSDIADNASELSQQTRYVSTLEAMFAANNGDANDVADVLVGKWPRSLTGDGTHPNAAGKIVRARCAYGAIVDLGWITGQTTALPGVPTSVTGGAGTLTWAAPASDGGHGVLGYSVQINSGSWVAVATQGSPVFLDDGAPQFTKQYIRSMTGLASGSYRVAAITRKGTGTYAEAVVT